MNISVKTSPAESPWCNGTVERHNGILGQMIEAVLEDTRCNIDIAIAWSVNAKNSLNNVYGFSPYQLVMGRNPTIPSILSYENLPALNNTTSSKIVAEHLSAMEVARKKFIELENSDRMRRILRERVYESSNERYLSGDVVYFKREKSGWQGPATVVGQLGNQVLLKHGGMLIRIHPCKIVLKAKADSCVNKDAIEVVPGDNNNRTISRQETEKSDTSSESSSDSDSNHGDVMQQSEPVNLTSNTQDSEDVSQPTNTEDSTSEMSDPVVQPEPVSSVTSEELSNDYESDQSWRKMTS